MKKNQKSAPSGRSRIKKGDMVIVIAGKHKPFTDRETGKVEKKIGRVLEVYPKTGRVLIEDVALARRSYRKGTNPAFPDGGIHDKAMPIAISNVMLVDPKTGEPTRVGIRFEEGTDGKVRRVRFAKGSDTAFKD